MTALLLSVLALVSLLFIKNEQAPVRETASTVVKELPLEVEEKIGQAIRDESFKVPILMYHYVEYVKDTNDTIRQSLNINPDIFEAQVKALSEAGYTFLTMKDLAQIIDDNKDLPDKPVAITFDDGHWDIVTDVLPILKKYRAKATVFVITGFLNGSDFLSDEQIEILVKAPEIEIGAHTVHHASLANRLPFTLTYEIEESKRYLEETYNIWVVSFAYPNGDLDLPAMEAVRKGGFLTAVSTAPGVNVNKANRYALYRLRPGRRTGESLIQYLEQGNFNVY